MVIHECRYFNEITKLSSPHMTFICAECSKEWYKIMLAPRHTHIFENGELRRQSEDRYKFIEREDA